jgi:short-subunit dehydrogenase
MKTVIISGASTGIGLAIAEKFVKEDMNVIGLARDFTKTNFEHAHFINLLLLKIKSKKHAKLQKFGQIASKILCLHPLNFC